MDFTSGDRQRARAVEDAHRRGQVIVSAQVFVELAAMGLLDDQNAFDAFESDRHLLRPGRRQQAWRDNAGVTCRPCQRAQEAALAPPEVPPEFWENDQLRDALVMERHIGHAVRSYRKHPFHGQRPISQETAARWLSVSQTQLSRIENGHPIYDLDRLMQWAKMLRIPPELLWFALPDEGDDVKRRQFMVAGGATALGFLSPAATSHAANTRSPDGATGEACACSRS